MHPEVYPESVAEGTNARIIARFPDSHLEPLLWLYEYNQRFPHPFLLRKPIELPVGTTISGIPAITRLILLPGKKPAAKAK